MTQVSLFTSVQEVMTMSSDPCARKHQGNPESIAAHDRIVHTKEESYNRILAVYQARRDYGATSHEISGATGMPLQTVSARLSELRHKLHKLKANGQRRNNAAVLVLA